VLGLVLLGGWQYWKTHTANQAAAAAKLYDEFRGALDKKDVEAANRTLNTLVADHKTSPYTQQSRLLLAKQHVEAGKFDEAVPLLRAVADGAHDEQLAQIAKLRAARLMIQLGKHDDALKSLDPEKAGAFVAQVREVRGDALVAKGDLEGARAEYAAALAANDDASIDRTLLELKQQDIGGTAAKPAAQVAP